jgi:hypothetical protein
MYRDERSSHEIIRIDILIVNNQGDPKILNGDWLN